MIGSLAEKKASNRKRLPKGTYRQAKVEISRHTKEVFPLLCSICSIIAPTDSSMRPTLLFYAKVICCTISNCFKFLTLRWCFVFFLYVSCYLKKMNVSHFRWKTFWQKSDSICPSPHQIQPRPQLWILIGNNKVAATLRTLIHSHLRSERSRCVFHALETTTTTKRVECSNTGSLRGLLVPLPWIRTHTETRHAIFFYLFSSPVFWFCIIKLMTCQLTEVGLFFFFFCTFVALCKLYTRVSTVFVCMYVQKIISIRLWLSMRACRLCIFVNESLRSKHGDGLRIHAQCSFCPSDTRHFV